MFRFASLSVSLALVMALLPRSSTDAARTAAPPMRAISASRAAGLELKIPQRARHDRPFVVRISLPASAAAVDGRIVAAPGAVELWGVAPVGGGVGLRPEHIEGGMAFGAYDLRPVNGRTTVRLVLEALRPGRLELRIAVDAVADASGQRLGFGGVRSAVVEHGASKPMLAAPAVRGVVPPAAARAPRATPSARWTETARSARLWWSTARAQEDVCGATGGYLNPDGSTDIVDVQLGETTLADQATTQAAVTNVASGDFTFTVTSSGDGGDADRGDGRCRDGSGSCTLRAAIEEANTDPGDDRIRFDVPGTAPVVINVSSALSIGSGSGSVEIDGYTQPGSRVNTRTDRSTAVPGVDLRGPGAGTGSTGFYITSGGNEIRGFAISEVARAVFVDKTTGVGNRILGNFIGLHGDGRLPSSGRSAYGVLLNGGASRNVVGTPTRADRNVIYASKGIDHYGYATAYNVEQNNQLCIRPDGVTPAQCMVGIDHDFGPKHNVNGGSGANERNVFGPTGNQGIEYSHGWNPSGPRGAVDETWQVSDNRAVGNWVGFRADGSYDPAFRSGLNDPAGNDNGQAINVHDGSNRNLIKGNYCSSPWMGIQVMSSNSRGNIIRDNHIGVSPTGQLAPMSQWGIRVRIGTRGDHIVGNVIRRAALGGIGVTDSGVFNIRISKNLVFGTSGLGIDLFGRRGPDRNDPGDADEGANHLLNSPVITRATRTVVRGRGLPGSRVEIFKASRAATRFGLPARYLGRTTVGADGRWRHTISLKAGARVTALQIDVDDNTSELAANVSVG